MPLPVQIAVLPPGPCAVLSRASPQHRSVSLFVRSKTSDQGNAQHCSEAILKKETDGIVMELDTTTDTNTGFWYVVNKKELISGSRHSTSCFTPQSHASLPLAYPPSHPRLMLLYPLPILPGSCLSASCLST